jgi:hypothetical protein
MEKVIIFGAVGENVIATFHVMDMTESINA